MKQSNKTPLQTKLWFGSIILLVVTIVTANIFAGTINRPIIPIGMAWCQCPFHPSEVCKMDDWMLFADNESGQIFTFTHDGVFNGNLSRSGNCEGPEDFSPYRLAEIDNLVFATCHKENAIKALVEGKVTSSITPAELGFPDSKPMAIAVNDYYIYVALNSGHLLALYFDFELEKSIEVDCVAIDFLDDNLLVLTQDSKLLTFDDELNLITTEDHFGHYIGQLQNPVDMAVDNDGNIWFAEKERVTVWFENGNFGSWGDKCTDRDGSNCGISGDPIAGGNGVFVANSIDASDEYFYVTRDYKHGFAVPRDNINIVTNDSVHLLTISLSTDQYWDYAKNIWLLQQSLYPQVLISIFQDINKEEIDFIKDGIYLDGQILTDDMSELKNIEPLSIEILSCLESENMTQILFDGENIEVDFSTLRRPFKSSLVLLEIGGSMSPLLVNSVEIINPDRFLKVKKEIELPDSPSILYAIILDPDKKCVGARILRNSQH